MTAAKAQDSVKVAGRAIDQFTGEGIPYVHVFTSTLQKGTVTDEKGYFIAQVSDQDTLLFSCVGYHLYNLRISELGPGLQSGIVIPLSPKSYLLNDVNVNAYPSLDQFKQEIVGLNIEHDAKSFSIDIPSGYLKPSSFRSTLKGEPGISITGPFSALYNAFSREGRESRKLRSLHRQLDRLNKVDEKYNLKIVKNLTELSDEKAKRFMEWCTFDEDYILHSSEYELAVAILKCLDEFHEADTLR